MSGAESARKQAYFTKLVQLLNEFNKIFIVGADNVGSNQMQTIRKSLRGKGVVLMGKNTMIRKAIRGHIQNNAAVESLLPYVRGNIGFIFCKDDLSAVKKIISENKVAAPAKAGGIAPSNVVVPAGNTGLEPTQTSFFQALNIATKINKGQIEITNDVNLIKAGDRVGASEAGLLAKLNIKPFAYGLQILGVWDNGSVYGPEVLELTDEAILAKFNAGVKNIAALGLQIGYPTIASLPHSVIRGYKNVLAISLGTEYSFPQAQKVKDLLANPGAFTAPAPVKTEAPKKEEKKEEKKPEVKEEEPADVGLGGGLFGDDEEW